MADIDYTKKNLEWTAAHEAEGAKVFKPRGEDSDYNQHHLDVDLDDSDFWKQLPS